MLLINGFNDIFISFLLPAYSPLYTLNFGSLVKDCLNLLLLFTRKLPVIHGNGCPFLKGGL